MGCGGMGWYDSFGVSCDYEGAKKFRVTVHDWIATARAKHKDDPDLLAGYEELYRLITEDSVHHFISAVRELQEQRRAEYPDDVQQHKADAYVAELLISALQEKDKQDGGRPKPPPVIRRTGFKVAD